MKPRSLLVLLVLLCAVIHSVSAEGPAIEWQRLLGGSSNEFGHSVQPTADGGYILLGGSSSSQNGDVTGTRHGSFTDFWVVKLDRTGTIQWQKLLGGTGNDEGYSVQQTTDGGYILLGSSGSSKSGDVAGTNHGGSSDVWVVKLNSAGTIQWQTLLGGSGYDAGRAVQQTADGGYVLLGVSESSQSGDVTGINHGSRDYWVVKLNGAGTIQWQKLLGGYNSDEAHSVQQTADGGYILLGESSSTKSGDVTGMNHGNPTTDSWVVKLNSAGAIQWQKLLGGSNGDLGYSVRQTADGGYILLGASSSSQSGDVAGMNHGGSDFWVVKLDDTGTIQWQRLLGGGGLDGGRSVRQTADGGYILLGDSLSSASGDVTGTNRGYEDFWVVKLDDAGLIEWQKTLGGSYREIGYSVQQTADGGYVLLGDSLSSESGDVTGSSHYMTDYWVVKLAGGQVIAVPGAAGIPGDIDTNGKYEDVNGNGRKDFADVVLYFNQMTWIAANEPVAAFDCNGNGRIDFADVVWLFNHL